MKLTNKQVKEISDLLIGDYKSYTDPYSRGLKDGIKGTLKHIQKLLS